MDNRQQKRVEFVPVEPPPVEQRVKRNATFAAEGESKNRYHLPDGLESGSPVGYRVRVRMENEEVEQVIGLLDLDRPKSFSPGAPLQEKELFEECSLGVLTSRQSTNFRGHRQITIGAEDCEEFAEILHQLDGTEGPVLDHATHGHVVLTRPYRTPFTMLLTFIGHKAVRSVATVPIRALRKKFQHIDDIPTVGYLQHVHIGVLADGMERAAIVASSGRRSANIFVAPFCGESAIRNKETIRKLENFVGLTASERAAGWRIAIAAQVGEHEPNELNDVSSEIYRKLGANLLAFRSERIQPGVNQEEKAPEQYHTRQDMDVPEFLTVMSGRAAYNAFVHWTGCSREVAKQMLLLERIDVLTPNGKQRLRDVRDMLGFVTERVLETIPLWADVLTAKALSRNAARGKKAFALAGQRIYVGGLDRTEIERQGIDWERSLRAFGAAAARSALVAELMGVAGLPDDCDLLAGICLMAGPVNQNDIGKSFYGQDDMLKTAFPDKDPTSLLVWTLKAKTIADPIGNEEQLMNPERKGALVDLRPSPHEVVTIKNKSGFKPFRKKEGRTNQERAFSDVGNFVCGPEQKEIPGNRGSEWGDDPLFD